MRIFGLDLGTTSVGFAVVDIDEARQEGKILRLGARIFPEARDTDGAPFNQIRRMKRMMRRQLRRRRERRRSLNELLASHGLLPAFGVREWAEAMAVDPYDLRVRGLIAALEPHELGRALYHLAKRRHFRERDVAEGGEEKEAPKAEEAEQASARENLIARLKQSGQTLGDYLAGIGKDQRKRGVYATRAIVEDEYKRFLEAQSAHHPVLNDRVFQGALEEAIFHQRPVFWRKKTLGACRYFPDAPLCPKGSWLSQQRRMLEKVNVIEIRGGNERPLAPDERSAILAVLSTQKSMTWAGVRKALEPLFKARGESAKGLKFNLEYGDEKGGLKGNIVEAELARIFGLQWRTYDKNTELRRFLPQALWEADYGEIGDQRVVIRPEKDRQTRRRALAALLVRDFGASPAQAEELIKLKFPQGWEPYSTRALEIFLPELEKGEKFGTLTNSPEREAWRDEHFPERERPTGEVIDRLPSPKDKDEALRFSKLRNPTVVRVQNEMRKVVNNLISVYGKPDLIRVELAREVGKSKKEREEISSAMRAQERRRKDAQKELEANGRANPSRDDIEKYLLWEESGKQCPYTGDMIGFEDLWNGHFEVEHIWPRSISFDNSFANKTLCRKDVNAAKGDRIPHEYFKSRPDDWEIVKERVWNMVRPKGMSTGKAKRFTSWEIPETFKNRQLTDTGYAARAAVQSLQRLWPDVGEKAPVNVRAVTGRVTAQLRRGWGLNNILSDDGEKTRADHRHHAIDALVVACIDEGQIQKLSRWFKERDAGKKPHLPEPWPSIRADAEKAIKKIVVSHRVRKKVSGPLHLETIYGDTGKDERTKSGAYRLFVTRKPLERLSKKELDKIVDPNVGQIVRDWVSEHGGDPKKAFAALPRLGKNGAEIKKARIHIKQQVSLMAPVSTGFADLGNNHHVAVYRMPDGKIRSSVVSLFEATGRLARKLPIVDRTPGDGSVFVMSLAQGDTLYFSQGSMSGYWSVQSIWSAGPIVLHRTEDSEGVTVTRPVAASILRDGGRKVSVDPIGRVRPAND